MGPPHFEHHRRYQPLNQRVLAACRELPRRRRGPLSDLLRGRIPVRRLRLRRTRPRRNGQHRFAAFKANYTQLIRFMDLEQDDKALQAGFRYHFVVNNAVIMADRFTPAQDAYILNSKYIFPVFNANDYFKVDPWMQPSNQRVVVSKIYLTWQIACISPRMNVCVTPLA